MEVFFVQCKSMTHSKYMLCGIKILTRGGKLKLRYWRVLSGVYISLWIAINSHSNFHSINAHQFIEWARIVVWLHMAFFNCMWQREGPSSIYTLKREWYLQFLEHFHWFDVYSCSTSKKAICSDIFKCIVEISRSVMQQYVHITIIIAPPPHALPHNWTVKTYFATPCTALPSWIT